MARRKNTKRTLKRQKTVKKRGGKQNKKSFANALRKLSALTPSQRVAAMKLANDKFIRQFCQHVKSLRYKPLSSKHRNQLRRQSKELRKMLSAKTSIKSKRKMLTQRGGILPLLLAPLISTLAGSIIPAVTKSLL